MALAIVGDRLRDRRVRTTNSQLAHPGRSRRSPSPMRRSLADPGALLGSLAGWATGLAIFLPIFLLGGLGAGDVKLMACLGAWLGATLALWTAAYAALAGGVAAIIVAPATGYLRAAVDNLYLLLSHFRVAGVRPHPELTLERGKGPRLPYALPIAAGMVVALWLH